MDLSKLPKLSDSASAKPPADPTAPIDPTPPIPLAPQSSNYGPIPPSVQFADIWISIGVGVILLVMTPRFIQWMLAKGGIGQFTWTFSDEHNLPISYAKSVYFLGDLAIFAFAIVLILDGLVAAIGRPKKLLSLVVLLTIVTTLLNLYYVATMFSTYGPQLFSLLAFVFGVYILSMQLTHLKSGKQRKSPGRGENDPGSGGG